MRRKPNLEPTALPRRGTAPARALSKWSIFFGTVLVIVLSLIKGFWKGQAGESFALSVDDIIKIGAFCVAVWSPIYVSLWLDKIMGAGNREESCGESDQ